FRPCRLHRHPPADRPSRRHSAGWFRQWIREAVFVPGRVAVALRARLYRARPVYRLWRADRTGATAGPGPLRVSKGGSAPWATAPVPEASHPVRRRDFLPPRSKPARTILRSAHILRSANLLPQGLPRAFAEALNKESDWFGELVSSGRVFPLSCPDAISYRLPYLSDQKT